MSVPRFNFVEQFGDFFGLHTVHRFCRVMRCTVKCYVADRTSYNASFLRASLYLAANSVFGKVGRVASEEITIQLFNSKCLPVLLYGLEACSLSESDLSSIDFAFNRFFMKLFRTNNIETVKVCQSLFGISLPSVVLRSRTDKFDQKFSLCAEW